MTTYSIIYNATSIVALPAVDCLTDLAMEKGWKIMHTDVDFHDLQQYKDRFNMEVMDAGRFHLDYLAEDLLTEEDTAYIESCYAATYYEDKGASPDADEEEFDEMFEFAPLDLNEEETE